MNYRNEPLWHRTGADLAYAFSFWVHGDPFTPLMEAYPGDLIKIRLVQGGFEEQHNSVLQGLSWKREPADSGSGDTQAQTIGTSEAFSFAMSPNPAGVLTRDYLWSSHAVDDIWADMWGLLRIYGKEEGDLPPLADRPDLQSVLDTSQLARTGSPPGPPDAAGKSCPSGAPIRRYDVVAIQRDLVYNGHGDHDPYGMLFVAAADEEGVLSGAIPPRLLVMRANASDCIEVRLTNRLPKDMAAHADPAVPHGQGPWTPISMAMTGRWTPTSSACA